MKSKYEMGQRVSFLVSVKIEGIKATVESEGWITSMRFSSDTEKRFIEYGITDDLIDAYHGGRPAQWWCRAHKMREVIE